MPSLENFSNIALGIFFLIYCGAVFTIFYHLIRFGVGTHPKRLAAIFFLGSAILSGLTLLAYHNVDFTQIFQ